MATSSIVRLRRGRSLWPLRLRCPPPHPSRRSPLRRSWESCCFFFLKAGSVTFGSGLVIVPFLEQGLVRAYAWLDQRQFLVAVAIGMISPGPVVNATFVGYLVAGFWGSLASTIGIFLPSFILVLVAAPILARHRANPNVQGFVKGAYAAAIGTILGACILLGRIADRRLAHAFGRTRLARGSFPLEGQQPAAHCGHSSDRTDCLSTAPARLGDDQVRGCPVDCTQV